MKIAVPYYGKLWIPLAGLLHEVGLDLVLPNDDQNGYLKLGKKYAPQEWGMASKLQVGSYLVALESGAEQLLMITGCSQCQDQFAGETVDELLQELGYNFQTIELGFSRTGLLRGIGRIAKGKQKIKLLSGIKRFWWKVQFLSYLEENRLALGSYMSVYEHQYYELILKELLYRVSAEDLHELIWGAEALFEVLAGRWDGRPLLKIGILGEPNSLQTAESVLEAKDLLLEKQVPDYQYLRFDQWLKGQLGFGRRKKVEEYLNSAISV